MVSDKNSLLYFWYPISEKDSKEESEFWAYSNMKLLEIKPCGLGSRIRDMEAEWRLKFITDLIS